MPEPRSTADLAADLRRIASNDLMFGMYSETPVSDIGALREAAVRLERPRFSAEQMQAVADAIGAEYIRTGVTRFLARAALSAIGEVDGG